MLKYASKLSSKIRNVTLISQIHLVISLIIVPVEFSNDPDFSQSFSSMFMKYY